MDKSKDLETEQQCDIHVVSISMADKAQMINALINTMDICKNKLGGYHSIRDGAREKLEGLIKSIDI